MGTEDQDGVTRGTVANIITPEFMAELATEAAYMTREEEWLVDIKPLELWSIITRAQLVLRGETENPKARKFATDAVWKLIEELPWPPQMRKLLEASQPEEERNEECETPGQRRSTLEEDASG